MRAPDDKRHRVSAKRLGLHLIEVNCAAIRRARLDPRTPAALLIHISRDRLTAG
jgi:hypothetical protein